MNGNNNKDPRKRYRKTSLQEKEYRLPLQKKYLDTFDMMQLFNVTPRTLQRWRTEGIVKARKVGGRIYYLAEDVDDMMRGEADAPDADH